MQKKVRISKGNNNQSIENVIADAESEISIVAEQGSVGAVSIVLMPESQKSVCNISIKVEDNAEIKLTFVQLAQSDSVRIVQKSTVGKEAKLYMQNVTLGGVSVDHALDSEVIGEHGISSVDWVFYAKNTECYNVSATNIYNASSGRGEIVLKGVAEDRAHIQCNGMINIGLKGGGADAYLTENVLMLDSSAKVDALPALEIKTNDVKASHSATVSQVSAEELFYFASRGITEEESRKMYIEGFLGSIIQSISQKDLQRKIVDAIAEKYSR